MENTNIEITLKFLPRAVIVNNVDVLLTANGVDTPVQTVPVTGGTDSQLAWNPSVNGNMQATIAPSGFTAGISGQYYVYVVLPDAGNTLIFAVDRNGSAGGHSQTFQQDFTHQPYFTTPAMEASKVITLLPAASAADLAGVEVYAGYRLGTAATDAIYWGYLHTFPVPAP